MVISSNMMPPRSFQYLNDKSNTGQSYADVYSSAEIATKLGMLTNEDYTAQEVENKFGKSYVTDSDLYFMVDGQVKGRDGVLTKNEVKQFMNESKTVIEENIPTTAFPYWHDDKIQYSVNEIAQQMSHITGRDVHPDHISALAGGKKILSDFDIMILMDQSRDGILGKNEVEKFIVNNSVDIGMTPALGTSYQYQGDGLWDYTPQDFMGKVENALGVKLNAEAVHSHFTDDNGVFKLDDRILKNTLDMNDDGKLSWAEINPLMQPKAGVLPTTEALYQSVTYLGDGKSNYTPAEVASIVSNLTGKMISETDVNMLTGGAKTITDYDMFQLFDVNRDGKVTTGEAERLLADGTLQSEFKYLNDMKTSYTPAELSKALSQIGIIATPAQVQQKFGKSVITDNDIFMFLDKANPQTGYKDGILKQEDIKKPPILYPLPPSYLGVTPVSYPASNPYLSVLLGGQGQVLGQNPQLDMMRYMTGNIQMM